MSTRTERSVVDDPRPGDIVRGRAKGHYWRIIVDHVESDAVFVRKFVDRKRRGWMVKVTMAIWRRDAAVLIASESTWVTSQQPKRLR